MAKVLVLAPSWSAYFDEVATYGLEGSETGLSPFIIDHRTDSPGVTSEDVAGVTAWVVLGPYSEGAKRALRARLGFAPVTMAEGVALLGLAPNPGYVGAYRPGRKL